MSIEEKVSPCEVEMETPNIVFEYVARTWDDSLFREKGGIVAVVLNYNKKQTIRQATLSALNQATEQYEVLCLDDCSQDGSAELMLDEVRDFVTQQEHAERPRALKIKVILNRKNRTVLGQWQLAARTSDGMWFGMFCGDDIARENRVSDAREIITECPTAWGICTNMAVGPDRVPRHALQRMVWTGTSKVRPMPVLSGCTAFWHRRCFDFPLPAYNIDDSFLYWTVVIRAQNVPNPVLIWAYDKIGIDYDDESGISTSYLSRYNGAKGVLSKIGKYRSVREHDRKYARSRWTMIKAYDRDHGVDSYVREQILGMSHLANMRSGGWWERLHELCVILFVDRNCGYGGMRKGIVRSAKKIFVYYFAGALSYVIMSVLEDAYHKLGKRS